MPEQIDNEMLSMLFDVVLILSVAGLWILWWRQLKQRKNIEKMLVEASTQLQEATLMLNQALVQIRDLQPQNESENSALNMDSRANDSLEEEQLQQKIKQKVYDVAGVEEQDQSTANISQVAQMLRLQREGTAPEKIAQQLNVPLAQIKLMLMLQPGSKR